MKSYVAFSVSVEDGKVVRRVVAQSDDIADIRDFVEEALVFDRIEGLERRYFIASVFCEVSLQ